MSWAYFGFMDLTRFKQHNCLNCWPWGQQMFTANDFLKLPVPPWYSSYCCLHRSTLGWHRSLVFGNCTGLASWRKELTGWIQSPGWQVWASPVPPASRKSTQPLNHLKAFKAYICTGPRPLQCTRGNLREGLLGGRERMALLACVERWMGPWWAPGQTLPFCFASFLPFFSQGQTENGRSCSCVVALVKLTHAASA